MVHPEQLHAHASWQARIQTSIFRFWVDYSRKKPCSTSWGDTRSVTKSWKPLIRQGVCI